MADKLIIGCGYLGDRVATAWQRQGHRVFVTTRNASRAESFRQRGLEPLVCDILEPATLRQLPRVESVLHSVGFDRGSGRSYREVYVGGLSHVLDALPAPDRFLHVSSTGVYGQSRGEEVDETSATEPVEESGRIMLEAEQLLAQRLPNGVRLRFSGIYGPGRLLRRAAIVAGEVIAVDPEHWLNLIHIEDGAAAVLAADARAQPGQVINVSDDRPVRRREYYGLLAQVLKAPEPRFGPPRQPDSVNRRVLNRRLRSELGVELQYPTIWQGLPKAQ